ncbi:MAG: MamK family actin-like protein [Rhodospirillaceae bacterium]
MSEDKLDNRHEAEVGEGNRLIIGIDLGTSRTSVMTNRGIRKLFQSVVGYPRDVIGVRLLGAPFAVGEQAYERRSFLELRYPLEDGVVKEGNTKDLTAARQVLKHAVDIAEPSPGDEVRVIIGVPARASAGNKSVLLQIAEEIVNVAVVISQPFLVAYHYGKLYNAMVIDIGAGTVDICALKGMIPPPEDQLTLKKAGNYIDERLKSAILDRYPDVQININIARGIKEAHAYVGKPHGPIQVELRSNGLPVLCDVTDEVRQSCESIVPDIVESVESLIRRFPPDDLSKVLQNIIIAGGGSRIAGLSEMLATKLRAYGDVKVALARDPEFDGASGALMMGQELPPKFWDQLGDTIGES